MSPANAGTQLRKTQGEGLGRWGHNHEFRTHLYKRSRCFPSDWTKSFIVTSFHIKDLKHHISHKCTFSYLLPPAYVVRGKVLFSQVSVCPHLGGVPTFRVGDTYLPRSGRGVHTLPGGGVPTFPGLDEVGYLP